IAQEVEKVFPELVGLATSSSGETNKTVEYGNLVAPLIEAVKELKTEKDREIRSLQEENSLLKSENESIKTRLELLEKAVLNSKQ
ncbi:hypothetical protein KBD33_05040, partial [Candidatus Gracilibacteria bacterium]|nr:hypothetical protein [Candidatus Gracilibacteria bacterium]